MRHWRVGQMQFGFTWTHVGVLCSTDLGGSTLSERKTEIAVRERTLVIVVDGRALDIFLGGSRDALSGSKIALSGSNIALTGSKSAHFGKTWCAAI